MKKTLLALLFFGVLSYASAQTQGDIRLNASLALGTAASIDSNGGGTKLGLGINVGGEYLITDVISVSPSFTYFFPSKVGSDTNEITFRTTSFNIDGRYYFLTGDLQFYGLLGIAVVGYTLKYPDSGFFSGGKFSDSEAGLNIGGGIVYPISEKIGLNGQLKYATPGYDNGQLVINGGVAISLN